MIEVYVADAGLATRSSAVRFQAKVFVFERFCSWVWGEGHASSTTANSSLPLRQVTSAQPAGLIGDLSALQLLRTGLSQ